MPLGLALKQLVSEGVPPITFIAPSDLFFNPSTSRVWVADPRINNSAPGNPGVIPAFNSITQARDKIVDVSSVWGVSSAARIVGDATNIYACAQPNLLGAVLASNPSQILIINQASGAIVGICQVTGTNNRVAIDLALDGAGNLFALGQESFGGFSTGLSSVQKFNIAAAIGAFPAPTAPSAISADAGSLALAVDTHSNVWIAHSTTPASFNVVGVANGSPGSISIDPLGSPIHCLNGTTATVDLTGTGALINGASTFTGPADFPTPFTVNFPGTTITGAYAGGGTVTTDVSWMIETLDATSLATVQTFTFSAPHSGPSNFAPLSIVLGPDSDIWVACTSDVFQGSGGQVLRIDPTTFPAQVSIVGCAITGNGPYRLVPDPVNNEMCVGCAPSSNQTMCRISLGGAQLSSFAGQGLVNPTIIVVDGGVPGPTGVWETAQHIGATQGEIALYSSTVGSETFTSAIVVFT